MNVQEKEMAMMKSEITKEVRAIFKTNMKIFDWDIPENDDKKAAEMILGVMEDALNELKDEIASGQYNNY